MSPLPGVDVSHHQGGINWQQVADSGVVWAFIKRTEGTSFVDSRGAANVKAAQAARIVTGCYHFLRSANPRAQARHFVNVCGDMRGMLCALDVESGGTGGTDHPQISAVREFAAEFAALTGNHPLVIYTGRWYWVGIMKNPHGANFGPLWHSEYEPSVAEILDGPEGADYGGWSHATFWQFTSTSLGGDVPGIPGNEDKNLFYGTFTDLVRLTGVDTPPPTGEDWFDMATKEEFADVIRDVLGTFGIQLVGELQKRIQQVDFVDDPDGGNPWFLYGTVLRWQFPDPDTLAAFQNHWASRGCDTTVKEWSPAHLHAVPIANGLDLSSIVLPPIEIPPVNVVVDLDGIYKVQKVEP